MPAPTPEHILHDERKHLRDAREHLRAMREHTMSLTARAADEVSQAYLEAALYRRARALADDPSLPLFFGRIDRRTSISISAGGTSWTAPATRS